VPVVRLAFSRFGSEPRLEVNPRLALVWVAKGGGPHTEGWGGGAGSTPDGEDGDKEGDDEPSG
jgi:hypothetical protein